MLEEMYRYLMRGGPVMLPLLALSLIAWVYVFSVIRFLRAERTAILIPIAPVFERAAEKDVDAYAPFKGTRSLITLAVATLIRKRTAREDVLAYAMDALYRTRLLPYTRRLTTVKMIARVAPLLGLFGTVSGMITTFTTIAFYGSANPAYLSDGIAEAMLSTQAGLLVAFPLLFAHAILTARFRLVQARLLEAEQTARRVYAENALSHEGVQQ